MHTLVRTMSETLRTSDSSNSLNSLRRKAAEKAEEAIREQMQAESESASDTESECTPKPSVESPRRKAAEKAEEAIQEQIRRESESDEETAEDNEESSFETTLKPSASTSSFGSQRSVPRRRAAYKAAARIRKIAQQELPTSDSEEETPTQTRCVPRREKKADQVQEFPKPPTKEEDMTILSAIQTLLLLTLCLIGLGQMLTFFQNQCSC